MITKYSTGIPIIQPIESIDTDLTFKVLSKMQDKYDTGFLAVQKNIDKSGDLDLLKTEDQEYLKTKINDSVSKINNLGNINFGDTKLNYALNKDIEDISNDSQIKTGLISTKNVRSTLSGWDKLKSNPKYVGELWRPQNESYDTDRIQDYITGKSNSYSQTTPTYYYNYPQKLENSIKQIKSSETIKDINGNYYNVKELSEERIQAIARNQILSDPSALNQINIDGNYKFKGVSDEAIKTSYVTTLTKQLEQVDLSLKKVQANFDLYKNDNSEDGKKLKLKFENELKEYVPYQEAIRSKIKNIDTEYKRDKYIAENEIDLVATSLGKTYGRVESIKANDYFTLDKKNNFEIEKIKLNYVLDKQMMSDEYKLKSQLQTQQAELKGNRKDNSSSITDNTNVENYPTASEPLTAVDDVWDMLLQNKKEYGTQGFTLVKDIIIQDLQIQGNNQELITKINTIKTIDDFNKLNKDSVIKKGIQAKYNAFIGAYSDLMDDGVIQKPVNTEIAKSQEFRDTFTKLQELKLKEDGITKTIVDAQKLVANRVYGTTGKDGYSRYGKERKEIGKIDTSLETFNETYKFAEFIPSYESWVQSRYNNKNIEKIKKGVEEELRKNPNVTQTFGKSYPVIDKGDGDKTPLNLSNSVLEIAKRTGVYLAGETDRFALGGVILDTKADAGQAMSNNVEKFKTFKQDSFKMTSYNPTNGTAMVEFKYTDGSDEKTTSAKIKILDPQNKSKISNLMGIQENNFDVDLHKSMQENGTTLKIPLSGTKNFIVSEIVPVLGGYIVKIKNNNETVILNPKNGSKYTVDSTPDEAKARASKIIQTIEQGHPDISKLNISQETTNIIFEYLKQNIPN